MWIGEKKCTTKDNEQSRETAANARRLVAFFLCHSFVHFSAALNFYAGAFILCVLSTSGRFHHAIQLGQTITPSSTTSSQTLSKLTHERKNRLRQKERKLFKWPTKEEEQVQDRKEKNSTWVSVWKTEKNCADNYGPSNANSVRRFFFVLHPQFISILVALSCIEKEQANNMEPNVKEKKRAQNCASGI